MNKSNRDISSRGAAAVLDNSSMIGAKDKKIGIGDNRRGAAAVVFGGASNKGGRWSRNHRYNRIKICVSGSRGWITRGMRAGV